MTLRILHVIDQISLGGAARALITGAAHSATGGTAAHRIVSLAPPDPLGARLAGAAGLALARPERLFDEAAAADIVHVHFWNAPILYGALAADLPAMRVAVTCHVGGVTPPQILTQEVIDFADLVLATSAVTLEAADAGLAAKAVLAPSAADFGRLAGFSRPRHDGFRVGYAGSVDFAKMHPDYVALHTGLPAEARVLVAGDGPARPVLKQQATRLGGGPPFDFRGYVHDIAAFFAEIDVLGYPLCRDNYSTSELVLQEAMCAGLPCVVLPCGGAARLVIDGETGFVAATEADYAARLAWLAERPGEVRRLGEAAARHARAHFGADNLAPLIHDAYSRLAVLPKRRRPPLAPLQGAEAFVRSLGDAPGPFLASLRGPKTEAATADVEIFAAPAGVASAVSHYRRAYPDDRVLRLWSGLGLLGQGRAALAAGEFAAAGKAGLASRAEPWLRRAVSAAR